MRWITFPGSPRTHAVLQGKSHTVCGHSIGGASIARLGVDHRCNDCDYGWREQGAKSKPKRAEKQSPAEYQPRNVVEWERET